ncbi:MAG: sterol desaturase family protein [Alphaproteobacteria bacterium]|nr:sterol desaturase family protein [Alphaproteobacteria bacterium]
MLIFKTVVVVLWFAAFFIGERLRPANKTLAATAEENSSGGGAALTAPRFRVGRNLGLWFCNVLISPLVVLPVSAWAAMNGLAWRGDWWTGVPAFVVDIVILDFWIWCWHRANHEVGFLWRFHEVHHLDETLDASTALRFHFGEVILSAFVRGGVVWFLGIPLETVIVFEALVLAAAVFHHSNLALPEGLERRLSRVIVTPEIHWVHHHALRGDTDSRYGTIFSFWDRIFGTWTDMRRRDGMRIGVEGGRERGLAGLLARPFRPRR